MVGEGRCPGRAWRPADATLPCRPRSPIAASHKASAAGLRHTLAAQTIKVFKYLPLAHRHPGGLHSFFCLQDGTRER